MSVLPTISVSNSPACVLESSEVDTASASLGISKVAWWAVFLADSVMMSHWLSHFKVFTVQPSFSSAGLLSLLTVAFLFGTAVLVYDGYAKEWGKGTIRNTIPLFESLVRWQLLRSQRVQSTSVSSSSVETAV